MGSNIHRFKIGKTYFHYLMLASVAFCNESIFKNNFYAWIRWWHKGESFRIFPEITIGKYVGMGKWVILIPNKWKSTWSNRHNLFSVLETPSWSDEFHILWIWVRKSSWCKYEIWLLSLFLWICFLLLSYISTSVFSVFNWWSIIDTH